MLRTVLLFVIVSYATAACPDGSDPNYPAPDADGHVTIPDGVAEIPFQKYVSCQTLKSITLPDSVKTLKQGSFMNTDSLGTIDLNKVEVIGQDAFRYNGALTSITFPPSVREIGTSAFNTVSLLNNVVIPDTVKLVYGSAFYNTAALTTVSLSATTEVGLGAFKKGASRTISITFSPECVASAGCMNAAKHFYVINSFADAFAADTDQTITVEGCQSYLPDVPNDNSALCTAAASGGIDATDCTALKDAYQSQSCC